MIVLTIFKVQKSWLEIVAPRNRTLVIVWLVVGCLGWFWLGPVWLAAMRPGRDRVNDFYQDWASARNYWVGSPIYTSHAVSIPRYLGLPSNTASSIQYNAHPPMVVFLILPLGRLEYGNAILVWNGMGLIALALSFSIVRRN